MACLSFTAGQAQTPPIAPPHPLPAAGLLVISHVNIVDVVREYVLEDRTVVVRDGCIESVGKQAPTGRAVQRLNGRGLYLVPGLWDSRVCVLDAAADVQALPLYVAYGITSIRDQSTGRPRAELLAIVRALESGQQSSPRIELAGGVVDGPNGAGRHRAATRAEGRAQAEALLQEGWRGLTTTVQLPREAYLGVAEAARTWHVPLVGPIPEAVLALEAASAGHRWIEGTDKLLLGCSTREEELAAARAHSLAGSQPLGDLPARIAGQQKAIAASFSLARCQVLGQALARQQTVVIPMLLTGAAQQHRDLTPNDARLRYVPAAVRQQWAAAEARRPAEAAHAIDSLRRRMVAEFQRLGVPLMAGSGAGGPVPYVFHGASLLDELDCLVAAGLSPGQALQAATVVPAIAAGHRFDLGQIAPDYHADLLLLEGNPLEDIRNLRRVRAVVLRGRVLNQSALAALAADAARSAQLARPEPAASTH
ncbi:hypothetical protein Hsw_1941 [Hymenobacter swuensis DY53]|uniref:Amidohydrolase-related domain-containing protein n=1 Tax=Hymenobacter swuensis DY53 TaxID=1227739 RepID=W8F4L8_9BACT|nr:hypothetical protein Hsw_1941 [Hymenobacter swuensis DY53]